MARSCWVGWSEPCRVIVVVWWYARCIVCGYMHEHFGGQVRLSDSISPAKFDFQKHGNVCSSRAELLNARPRPRWRQLTGNEHENGAVGSLANIDTAHTCMLARSIQRIGIYLRHIRLCSFLPIFFLFPHSYFIRAHNQDSPSKGSNVTRAKDWINITYINRFFSACLLRAVVALVACFGNWARLIVGSEEMVL